MKNFKYVFMVLLGGSLYGAMSSVVKRSYASGFNAAEVSFAQALLAALFLGMAAAPVLIRKRAQVSAATLLRLLFTGSAIGLTNYLYYLSVDSISASLAIVVLMQFTWLSLIIEWLVSGKKPSRQILITLCLVMLGTVLAGGPGRAGAASLEGLFYAFAAAVCYAAYIVANSRVVKGVQWQVKGTVIMAGSALTIFLLNCRTITMENHFDYGFLPWALFLAIFGTAIPTALFAAGIQKIGAGISSILMTIELPVAIMCARILLDERLEFPQTCGVILMVFSISTMNYWKSRVPGGG